MVHVSGPSDRDRDGPPAIAGAKTGDGRFWLQEVGKPGSCWISSDLMLQREEWR